MGQCLSSVGGPGDTPERFRGRWTQQGGLGDGLAAFDAGKYGGVLGEPGKPAYTTTADVGLAGPRGGPEAGAAKQQPAFGYHLHDHKPPPPALQLERIDEDAALIAAAVPESSPMKPLPGLGGSGGAGAGPPLPGGEGGSGPIRRAPTSWTRGELVGQGAFGSVYVGLDNDTGELIAVKQVSVPRGGGAHARKVEENIRSVEEEVALLQQFDHPNIVRYLGTEKGSEALTIFLEYVPGGSIASLLAKFGSFRESVIRVYTKQILLGLEYLHSKGVMHRDIKGANILVDNTGLVKLADFGASKKLEDLVTLADGNKSVRGTPYWMAPEVITQTGHGRQADLWSVACTVLEMATGRPPWSAQYPSQVAAMFHIASSKGPPEIPQHLSPECKDFLYLCFNRDWKARPLASTLLRHPFLADVPVRSYSQPSPTCRLVPRSSGPLGGPSGGGSGGGEGEAGFGTPSPLHPRVAAAAAGQAGVGGAARISLADGGSGNGLGEPAAALSPLGAHAATRKQQWDSAATAQQQQQQQQQELPARIGRGGGGLGGSPVKRPALSLRASAPAFSGYASLALSQQGSDQLATPLAARPVAPPAAPPATAPPAAQQQQQQQQQQPSAGSSALRSSRGSGSRQAMEREASSQSLAAAAAAAAAAEEQQAQPGTEAGVAEETPAPQRQRSAVPDAAPDSAGNSSGTNKSDYNPMEEPSWLHPAESPLGAEGTPTSGLAAAAADGSPQQHSPAAAACGAEVSSYALAVRQPPAAEAQPAPAAPEAAAVEAPAAAEPAAAAAPPPAAPFDAHPSADGHLVWTNEDGDIDALPWDMGGWSTGSSGERGGAENAGAPPGQQAQAEQQPVGEDALIGALRRKAQHDVRASLALFEKSLNIPALHGSPQSPKAAAGGIPAGRAALPPLALPPPPAAEPAGEQEAPSAESVEGRGPAAVHGGGAPLSARRRAAPPLQALQPAPPPADDSRRHSAAVAQLLAGVRETATGALPPPAPLASAVGGLAGLGAYGGGGSDRESIWQQELSQELYRVKASTAAAVAGGGGSVANRRVSMHGSPIKRPGSIHQ